MKGNFSTSTIYQIDPQRRSQIQRISSRLSNPLLPYEEIDRIFTYSCYAEV